MTDRGSNSRRSANMNQKKIFANKVLTYTFVVFLLCIGLDKLTQTNLITNWQMIVGPIVHFLLPLSLGTVVMIEGAIEIGLGILLVTKWKTYSLVLLVVTVLLVTIDLLILHHYNLAIHEVMFIAVLIAIRALDQEAMKSVE